MIFSVVGWWLKPSVRREEQKASWIGVMHQHIFIFPLAFDPSSGSSAQGESGKVSDLAGWSGRWVMSYSLKSELHHHTPDMSRTSKSQLRCIMSHLRGIY